MVSSMFSVKVSVHYPLQSMVSSTLSLQLSVQSIEYDVIHVLSNHILTYISLSSAYETPMVDRI